MAKRIIVKLKRAYDPPEPGDGMRILVDRLWPRGVAREMAGIDLWLKDLAPSSALRKWFGHEPVKWLEFRERYFQELDENREAVDRLREQMQRGPVTLIFSAKDREHNNGVALQEYLSTRASA